MTIRASVFQALYNAIENGYKSNLGQMSYSEIASDLIMYDCDLEEFLPEDLIASIAEFFEGE